MRLIRGFGWTMIWAGGLIFAFLAYQLWGTGLITAKAQREAAQDLDQIFEESVAELEAAGLPVAPEPEAPAFAEPVLYPEPVPSSSSPFARIQIPAANVDHIVFEGVERDDLKKGPGHMPWTPLPGQPGNAVISGHRTTYEAPFYDLDLLEAGDPITVQTATGSHRYTVREILIVEPSDVWVTEDREGAWLTLTTCHPKASARQRLVVVAELVDGPNHAFVYGPSDDVEAG